MFRKFVVAGFMSLVLIAGLSASAWAAEKIAYVDLSQTFDKYAKTQTFDEQLTAVQGTKEAELERVANDIKGLEDKMSLLSDKEKEAKQKELDEKNGKLKQMSQEIALDLRKNRDEKLKEILQDIEKVVQDYAQKNGYDFILNDRVLLYGAASADVTQDIIDLLNASYKPVTKAAAKDAVKGAAAKDVKK